MATIAKLDVILGLTDNQFSSGLNKARDSVDRMASSMRRIGGVLTAGVTLPLAASAGVAINWAADLDESINKVNVLFGDAKHIVLDYSDGSAKALGFSQQATLDYSSAYAGMLNTVAQSDTELANMSTTLTGLTSDFASFHNLNPAEAFVVMQSALAGETEAIRRYGVDVSAAAVETKALELGLAETSAELTEQDKLLARYHILLEETSEESGDFGRTQDSVSNKMKIARARIQDVGAAFGRLLLPVVSDALDAFERLLDFIDDLSPGMQRFAIIVAALAAALGPLLVAIGFMLPGLSAMLGLFAALFSPIGLIVAAVGLLAFAFRDELAAALDFVVGKVEFAINVFRNLLDVGFTPLEAAVQTLTRLFPGFEDVVVPLGAAILHLRDAFQAIRDGDFGSAFDSIRVAASNVWESIQNLLGRIDLGDVAVSVGQWIAGTIPDIWAWIRDTAIPDIGAAIVSLPRVVVSVAGWVAGTIASVWDFLTGHVFGGNQGDGTGGATNPGFGGVTVASVALSILAWAEGTIPDAGIAVAGWLVDVAAELATVAISILMFDPVYDGTPIDILIEDMLGAALATSAVELTEVLVKILNFTFDADNALRIAQIALYAVVLATLAAAFIVALPVSVPVSLVLGAVSAILLAFALVKWVVDWAERNPIEAMNVIVDIALALGDINWPDPPSIDDLKEAALSLIGLPEDGFIRVSIGVIVDFFQGDDAGSASGLDIAGAADNAALTAAQEAFTLQRRQNAPFGGGGTNEFGANLAAFLGRSIATALDTVRDTVVTPKLAEWGSTVSAGLQPLPGIAGVSFGAITTTVTSQMGATAGALASRLASMTATATANFTSIRSTATSNTSQMATSVGSTVSTMASTSAATILGMKVGISANMLAMRTSGVSNAQSMASGVGAAMAGMSAGVRLSVSSAFNAIPGIIASAGASAVSTAIFVGRSIANGVAAGMRSALGSVIAASNEIIAAANRAMIAKALISSPSRLFMHHGEMIAAGLAMGIDAGRRDVMRATGDLVGLPGGLAGGGAGGGTTHYNPQVIFQPGSIVQQPGEDSAALAQRIGDVTLARLKTAFVDVEGVA